MSINELESEQKIGRYQCCADPVSCLYADITKVFM